jgi:hypothetical protein
MLVSADNLMQTLELARTYGSVELLEKVHPLSATFRACVA